MTDSSPRSDLAQRMSELALTLQDEDDRTATLRSIVTSAIDLIPGVTGAGISLIHDGAIVSTAPSHEIVAEIDQLQTDLGEGPCLAAIREQHTVRIPDLAASGQRWPRFAARAVGRGVRSMLSMRLFVPSEQLGALNLYADEPAAITEDSEVLADLVSQHAAVALAGATHEHHLNAALVNRDVIGQAKGILMERNRLTGQQAFSLLARASQDTNLKVADIARWLVDETERQALGRGVSSPPPGGR